MTVIPEIKQSEIKQSEKKNKSQIFGAFFFFFVIFISFYFVHAIISWMSDSNALPLSRLSVQGKLVHVSPEDVRDKLIEKNDLGTFLTQDVGVLKQKIETIPWVSKALVHKQWPDLIDAYIVERHASAIWNETQLLDEKGNVFAAEPDQSMANLPHIYGPNESSHEVLAAWGETRKKLQSIDRDMVSLVLNDRKSWQILLDNGIRLELGKDAYQERLDRFLSLYHRLGDKVDKISYIDLRYDTGAAVGWLSDDKLEQESK